jgi:hypothetical protein
MNWGEDNLPVKWSCKIYFLVETGKREKGKGKREKGKGNYSENQMCD